MVVVVVVVKRDVISRRAHTTEMLEAKRRRMVEIPVIELDNKDFRT